MSVLVITAASGVFAATGQSTNQSPARRPAQTDSSAQTQSASTGTSASTASIEIIGRVLDARNRQPIARALVGVGGRAVLTDHDGVFRFPESTFPSASFKVSKPGYYPSRDGEGDAPRPYRFPATAPIELLLFPEAILSGTAVDTWGESVPHLNVLVRRSVFDENGHHWNPSGQTQTASDGSFRLAVPSGVYSVILSQRGRPVAGAEVVLPVSVPAISSSVAEAIHLAPGEEVHLDLRPESRASHLVSLTVEPELRGFPVLSARGANEVSIPLSPMPVRGEDRSSLRVSLPRGTYTLLGTMQTQDGLSEAKTQITVTDHDMTAVPLRFATAPSLPVVIETDASPTSDNTTKPPEPLQLGLTLYPVGDNPDESHQTYRIMPRRNGTPAFSVPDGTYRLRAQAGGQWSITSAICGGVDLLSHELPVSSDMSGTEIRVRVSNQSANLTGSVTLNGTPSAAWIYLIATTPSASPVVILRSASDGTFFRPYLPVGTYRAIALESKIAADFQAEATLSKFLDRSQSFSVSAGEQRTLNLVAVPEQELPQ